MAILGPEPDPDRVAVSLNSSLFVRLIADVLAERGHTHIRILDGPGDGGRDIHSRRPNGALHLAQCKFKEDPKASVSSADVSELPIALMKFGYRAGLFATNGRLSPQAKREYLGAR